MLFLISLIFPPFFSQHPCLISNCFHEEKIYSRRDAAVKIKIQSKNGHKVIDINRKRAIRERCLNCSGWIPSDVRNCEHADCDLYPFRLGRGYQDPKARSKAIRAYCLWCMCRNRLEVKKCVCLGCPLFPYRRSKVDRSVSINFKPKKRRIRRCKRTYTSRPIPKYRPTVSV